MQLQACTATQYQWQMIKNDVLLECTNQSFRVLPLYSQDLTSNYLISLAIKVSYCTNYFLILNTCLLDSVFNLMLQEVVTH